MATIAIQSEAFEAYGMESTPARKELTPGYADGDITLGSLASRLGLDALSKRDAWFDDLEIDVDLCDVSEQLRVSRMCALEWSAYMYGGQVRFEDRRDWCKWAMELEGWRSLMKEDVVPLCVDRTMLSSPPSPLFQKVDRDMEEEPWKYGGYESLAEEEEDMKWEEEELWARFEALLLDD